MSRVANVLSANFYEKVVNFETLKDLSFEPLGNRHVPVPHYLAMNNFKEQLSLNKIEIVPGTESGLISGNKNRFMYIASVKPSGSENIENFSFRIGFINNNDESKSFRGICGYTYNDTDILIKMERFRSKHTKNVQSMILERSSNIILEFDEYRKKQSGIFQKMRNTDVVENDALRLIGALFRSDLLSSTNIKAVLTEYDKMTNYGDSTITILDFQKALCKIIDENVKNPYVKLDCVAVFNEIFNL